MKLYRLENNRLIESPSKIVIGSSAILNPTESQLRLLGYKELIELTPPEIEWYEKLVCNYTEDGNSIFENWNIEANDNLVSEYIKLLATERDRALENDFMWAGKVVKLDESNQKDYSALYTLLSNNRGMIPFVDANFKNHTSHFFADYDELNNFAISILTFVNGCLTIYRDEYYKIKDMTNDEIYQYILKNE